MNPRRRAVLVPLFVLAAFALPPLAAPLAAQEAEREWQPVESFDETVSVDVVNVEVWVTDRQGRPVTGLSREDFELYEDGKPVEIGYFTAFDAEAAVPADSAGSSESGPDEGLPEEELLRVTVFVDDWNLRPEDRGRVLGDLREFLRRDLRAGEEVMVVVHDGASVAVAQELTTDQEALAHSLDRVERRAPQGIQLRAERRRAYEGIVEGYQAAVDASQTASALNLDPCVLGWPDMENAFRSYASAVASHAQGSVSALASVLDSLAGVPGAKLLVYVGNGLPDHAAVDLLELLKQLCGSGGLETSNLTWAYDLNSLYDEVTRRANAHRITLYTLEAESPQTMADIEAGPSRFRIPAVGHRLRESSLEATLSRMAGETGGRAILKSADFKPAFAQISQDIRNYYSLGFVPDHRGDRREHAIRVALKGKDGHRLRHRSAYLDKSFERRMVERVYGVANLAGERNPLGVRVETGEAVPGTEGRIRLPLQLWVPLGAITMIPDGQGRKGNLLVMMAIVGADGAPGPVRQKRVPVVASTAEEERSGAGDKLVEVSFDLPPGWHRVAFAVRDELGGRTSYLRHDLDVRLGGQARLGG